MKSHLRRAWNNHKWSFFVVILFCVILALVANYVSVFGVARSYEQAVWGQFGDYFGGVLNPLLSFCAFVCLIATFNEQRAAAKAAEVRHLDGVSDARFFQILALLPQSGSQFKFAPTVHVDPKDNKYLESRMATSEMWRSLSSRMNQGFSNVETISSKYKGVCEKIVEFKKEVWPLAGFHFQLIMELIDFVCKSKIVSEQSFYFYLSLLKSQLTEQERLLVFYFYLVSDKDCNNLFTVDSAGFFESLPRTDIMSDIRKELLKEVVDRRQSR